jgi:hypothetical protein
LPVLGAPRRGSATKSNAAWKPAANHRLPVWRKERHRKRPISPTDSASVTDSIGFVK